ncbi:MAG: hypothetical protein ABIJ92_04820 [Candidatus Aenigmatarchaeota archaeon]
MSLDSKTIKQINDYVYLKPRTVQEVAQLISKNWRTADRYLDQISKETGSISTRVFRGGTKGALKIVFWSNIEKIHSSEFQERLLKKLESTPRKEFFSPFDIYQYVEPNNRNAVMKKIKSSKDDHVKDYLKSSQKQILSFSGNLSWINGTEGKEKLSKIIEDLIKNNVSIKILTRVTVDGLKNVKRVLEINDVVGKPLIELRHREQPLRGFVIDDQIARFREVRDPLDYKGGQMPEKFLLFYEIYDKEWISWFQKVFWYLFRTATPAEKRMKDLESIQNLYKFS